MNLALRSENVSFDRGLVSMPWTEASLVYGRLFLERLLTDNQGLVQHFSRRVCLGGRFRVWFWRARSIFYYTFEILIKLKEYHDI
jgi:hypothetical protein